MNTAVLAGRFQIVDKAGKGASGDVYRAIDERTGKPVAIKLLARALDGDALERFSREVRILARIVDPHVVRYVADGADEQGRPFVAVEWLEGEDLAARQRRAPLDGPAVLEVVRQAALGLAAIHAHGIVHRDIKPSNLFLKESIDGALRVTVIDLGVARTEEEETLITREGFMIGTPSYMSPEQVLGRRDVSAASDIFALGVVLFELVARARPYRADEVVGLVAKIALQEPPRLTKFAPDAPRELELVVATAMAREPASRFRSAEDFARAVSAAPPYVAENPIADPEEQETRAGTSGIATTERRIVTTVMIRVATTDDAALATEIVERVAIESGGASHRLLSLAYVIVFGGALSTGNEAQRAARAALALREQLPAARIAVATGRAVQGGAGVPDSAIGAAPSPPGAPRGIVIDAASARLLGDAFEIVEHSGLAWLVGERAARGPVRTLLGKATPCIGRDRELSQLDSLFDEVVGDSVARAAIVIGEPGAGKSRLVHELLERISRRPGPTHFLLARGSALAEGSPFGMLRSAIRAFARITGDEPLIAQRAKLSATIRDRAGAALIPLMARLASVDDPGAMGSEDGALLFDQLRVAFQTWLQHVTLDRPLCIVLEDLQHGDPPSVSMLDSALGDLSERPIFVVALGRPEIELRFPKLWNARSPITLRLGKLGKRAGTELAKAALGDRATPVLVDSIVARADGNPFFLEELLRAVSARTDAPMDVSHLPDTVLGMVQARLDALGAPSKRVLKAASIFGETFWSGAVAAILGETLSSAADTLRELARNEMVERRPAGRFQSEDEYAFRHALVRDAAYELLTDEDRALGHGRAGQWLEEHGEPEAIVLARHHDRSGKHERARPHYERAAEQALMGSDFGATIECAELALGYGSSGEARGRVLLAMAEARRWRGELDMALEAASFAMDHLEPASVAWFSAMREVVAAHGRLGHKHEMRALAERALSPRPLPGAESAQIAAAVPTAVHLLYGGDIHAADAVASRIERLAAASILEPRAAARLHQMRAAIAQHRDEPETAVLEQERALSHFDVANDRRSAALVRVNLGFALMTLGAYERAEVLLRETLSTAAKLGLGTIAPLAMQNLGAVLARLGRYDEALEMQQRSARVFAALRDPRLEGSSRVYLAQLHLARGDYEAAQREIASVLANAYEPLHVGAHATTAAASLMRGDAAAALVESRKAIGILDKLGSVEEFELIARITHIDALLSSGLFAEATEAARVMRSRVQARAAGLRDPELTRSFFERIAEHVRLAEVERRLSPEARRVQGGAA